jgi:hypothetical protein
MAKKIKNHTLEIQFDAPEPFALKVEQAVDGDKIQAEAEQLAADRHVQEMLTAQML